MGCDLAIESVGPSAGDLTGTSWAAAAGSQAVVFDVISVSTNQGLVALRAAGVFPMSDSSRKVAQIDVAQSGGLSDLGGAQQIVRRGIALPISPHLVVGVKCRDVPRNVRRNLREEFR